MREEERADLVQRSILDVRQLLTDRRPSVRMLLEGHAPHQVRQIPVRLVEVTLLELLADHIPLDIQALLAEIDVKANPPETVESISTKLIRDYGYTIIDKTTSFTTEELYDFYYELNNGGWDAFCADMVFPGSDGQRYWNDFHDLPTVDEYKHFFKP